MTDERTRVKRPHGLETQQALLVAAGQVFSRLAYSEARLKDIAEAADISQGALYFHFGNKEDVAQAVLDVQQQRMRAVLDSAVSHEGTALERMLRLFEGLGKLVATDELVQAGIRLSMQPATGLDAKASSPYRDWVTVARGIIEDGIADGSMSPGLAPDAAAELVNEIFVGAQTLAGLEDKWASLPRRVGSARGAIALLLTGSSRA
ncbi:ScbR family autoregulator-binding transcription factor [Microbacterium neimengense]